MRRKLLSLYLTLIFTPQYRSIRRFIAEWKRKLTFKPHVISVFLQVDDPYSYLLSHYLPLISGQYKNVELRYYLCQALRHEFMPAPEMLAEYAPMECELLAREFGVPFLDKGDAPVVEHRNLSRENRQDAKAAKILLGTSRGTTDWGVAAVPETQFQQLY